MFISPDDKWYFVKASQVKILAQALELLLPIPEYGLSELSWTEDELKLFKQASDILKELNHG